MRPCLGAVPLLVCLWACSQDKAVSATYEARGIVKRFVDTPHGQEVLIHHEDLPGFKDRSGKVVGMEAMVMPFGLGPSVTAEGMTVGDKVSFTFDMRWGAQPMLLITRLERLPPDAVVDVAETK